MSDFTLDLIYLVVVIIGGLLCYSAPKIYARYCDYKEEEMKESYKFQKEMEHLKKEQCKEDTKLKIEEERTKQEQIRLAEEIARKEKETENTKQLQIKADYKEKNNERLY